MLYVVDGGEFAQLDGTVECRIGRPQAPGAHQAPPVFGAGVENRLDVTLRKKGAPRHLFADVAHGQQERHFDDAVDQHMIDQPGMLRIIEVDFVGVAVRIAKDARALGVALLIDATRRLRVALRHEQPIHDALVQRLAPIDVDFQLEQPVAFGLAFEQPDQRAIVRAFPRRDQPLGDNHALGAGDCLLVAGKEPHDQRRQHAVLPIADRQPDRTRVNRTRPRPCDLIRIAGGIDQAKQLLVGQPVDGTGWQQAIVAAMWLIENGAGAAHSTIASVSHPPSTGRDPHAWHPRAPRCR